MLIVKLNYPKTAMPFWARMWEFFFAVLFVYAFFVQNVVAEISGMFIVLCGILAAFAILNVIANRRGFLTANYMWGITGFVALSILSSMLVSHNIQDSLNVGLRMIEYVIFACSLFGFLISYPERFFSIARYLWLSITALCVEVLFNGAEVTDAGAIGLESLNVNLLSSFITIQICLAFFLLVKSTKTGKLIYCASIILALFVQILAASRRGFIVACVFCAAAVFLCVIPRYTQKRSSLRLFVLAIILPVTIIILVNVADYIMNETALGLRFSGDFNSGDALREKYHGIAMQEFKEHPVLGVGLNGLENIMGVYSHSLYYETLACTGAVGAVVLFITLLTLGSALCKNAFGNNASYSDAVYISRLALGLLLALLVSGIAVTMIYDFFFYICLAILAAIALMNEEMCNNCGKTEF